MGSGVNVKVKQEEESKIAGIKALVEVYRLFTGGLLEPRGG